MAKKKMTLEEKLNDAIIKDAPYEVPENWVCVKLGDYIDYATDYVANGSFASLKENVKTYKEENYALMIRTKDFSNNFEKDCTYTDKKGYEFLAKSCLFGGELILSNIGASIGKVFKVPYLNKPMTLAPNSIMLKCDENSKDYLYYLFLSPIGTNLLKSISSGSATPKFNKTGLKDVVIPIPPLKEQQRIVDKIESLFEKLDKAKELIEEARDDFEKRKSVILEKAFRGELTDKVDLNEKDIHLIDNSIEFELFKSRYMLSNLSKIIMDKPRNGYSPKAVDYETSVKTLKLGAITRGKFNPNEFKYIDEDIAEDSYLWLKKGDFLIQRANSLEYVGISAIYDMEDDLFVYPDLIMKFRVKEDKYLPQLLWYWINSKYGRWYFTNNATGTAGNMPKINQKVVMNLPVPVIPLEEQIQIVSILDKIFEEESKIEELTALEEQIELIKKSILAKAFRGQLGTNSEEDESAIELLKEILQKE